MSVYSIVDNAARETKEFGAVINGANTQISTLHSIDDAVDRTIFEYSKIGKVTGVDVRFVPSVSLFRIYTSSTSSMDYPIASGSAFLSLNNIYCTLTGNTIYFKCRNVNTGLNVYYNVYVLTTKFPSGIPISDPLIINEIPTKLLLTIPVYSTSTGSYSTFSFSSQSGVGFVDRRYGTYNGTSWGKSSGTYNGTFNVRFYPIAGTKDIETYVWSAYTSSTSSDTLLRDLRITFDSAQWDGNQIPITLSIT